MDGGQHNHAPLVFDDLSDLSVLGRWAEVMRELAARGLIWSNRPPHADYAELLVARHFGVEPIRGSNPGFDLVTPEGRRVEVKSRRHGPNSTPGHFGEFSRFDDERFDEIAAVLFNEDFTVRWAYLASYDWVARHIRVVGDKHRLTIKAVVDKANELTPLSLDQT